MRVTTEIQFTQPLQRINTFTPGFVWNNIKDHEPQYVRERWFNPRRTAKREERAARRLAERIERGDMPRRNYRSKDDVLRQLKKDHEESENP